MAFEDDIEYFAAHLADYDPIRKEEILNGMPREWISKSIWYKPWTWFDGCYDYTNHSKAEITKLWLTKTWDLRHED